MLSKVRGGLIAGIAWCASTVAADAGWYVGVSGVAGRFAADYDKAVINSAPSPRAGQTFRDGDADESWKIGYGALAGYRFDIGDALHLSAEIDQLAHNPDAGGRLAGAGESPGRNQPGESWPDDWSMNKHRSYGLTLKVGARPAMLGTFMQNASLYALAGLRRVKTDFRLNYLGCLEPLDCAAGEFARGTRSLDQDFTAWTLGAGIEKRLGERLAVQGELRFTQYLQEDWLSFNLNGIEVPVELDGDDLDLAVTLIWRP